MGAGKATDGAAPADQEAATLLLLFCTQHLTQPIWDFAEERDASFSVQGIWVHYWEDRMLVLKLPLGFSPPPFPFIVVAK